MGAARRQDGIVAGRLAPGDYAENFADAYPPLDAHEALVAADRCYFCHDAPCIAACPTEIDIPLFIRQIQAGSPKGAAKTILDQNILGGMCARVCPTETLCEEACVRELAEGKPVQIGALQRYATDTLMATGEHPFTRAAPTGKIVTVIGAGPAGLACAHRLAMHGHTVVVADARGKPGGLNEYGIASYKAVDDFAQAEIDWLLKIGGIRIETGAMLGRDFTLEELRTDYDAVFLGMGLSGVNALMLEGADDRIGNAVDFIATLRQTDDLSTLPVGRRVVVIGGGMTAVDAAVQSRLLGAEDVTIVYRRGQENMSASRHEQDHATSAGVRLVCNAMPIRAMAQGVEFEYTETTDEGLRGTGETFTLAADQVFRAIGQTYGTDPTAALALERGRLRVDTEGRTSLPGVWAGGDCAGGGEDLTVTAVAEGRDAAESIHRALTA